MIWILFFKYLNVVLLFTQEYTILCICLTKQYVWCKQWAGKQTIVQEALCILYFKVLHAPSSVLYCEHPTFRRTHANQYCSVVHQQYQLCFNAKPPQFSHFIFSQSPFAVTCQLFSLNTCSLWTRCARVSCTQTKYLETLKPCWHLFIDRSYSEK